MAREGGFFRRTLEWFGLGDADDYEDEWEDDIDDEPRSRGRGDDRTLTRGADPSDLYSNRTGNVRPIGGRRGRDGVGSDFDDIWSSGGPSPNGPSTASSRPASLRPIGGSGGGGGGGRGDSPKPPKVKVHLVVPQGFNDAQTIADRFKDRAPVILNMQTIETELAKRLIDFASGLTYALDGGMQRVADRVFLLTPPNVSVSAEEQQQLVENGFFNQS